MNELSDLWKHRYMNIAREVGSWSKDPSTKVGCVLVDVSDHHRRIVSAEYNGFPVGMSDSPKLYADREYKYSKIIHAEMNALNNLEGNYKSIVLFSSFPVCPDCLGVVIINRQDIQVHTIIQPKLESVSMGKSTEWCVEWQERLKLSKAIADTWGIEMEELDV